MQTQRRQARAPAPHKHGLSAKRFRSSESEPHPRHTFLVARDSEAAGLLRSSSCPSVPPSDNDQIRELLDSLYRVDSGRILATLIRLLGDFDLAEEAMHEAFAAALSLWPRSGVPGNPRPWLISTARFKAIDTLRRRARFDASQDELVRHLEAQSSSAERSNEEDSLEDGLEDDGCA